MKTAKKENKSINDYNKITLGNRSMDNCFHRRTDVTPHHATSRFDKDVEQLLSGVLRVHVTTQSDVT